MEAMLIVRGTLGILKMRQWHPVGIESFGTFMSSSIDTEHVCSIHRSLRTGVDNRFCYRVPYGHNCPLITYRRHFYFIQSFYIAKYLLSSNNVQA